MPRITAHYSQIAKASCYESNAHRIYVKRMTDGRFLAVAYRVNQFVAIGRQMFNTHAGAIGYVKGFFNLPIAA